MSIPLSRILIVDDDPGMRTALAGAVFVRLKGVIVDEAGTGLEALRKADAVRYDAVITNLRMPGMDGRALIRAVLARHPGTPCFLLSGNLDEQVKDYSHDYLFIPKPIDRDAFFGVLEQALTTPNGA